MTPSESLSEKKTALYVRVSTDAQFEEGYSVEAQSEMLTAYCVSRQIRNYELYVDGGYSGSTLERPSIRRLMEDVNAERIGTVVVYKLDRLSRSQKDTLYLIEDVLNPKNVSFVSLNENMDTATPIGRAMLGIMSAFAQLERETIRERTRMGMKERVRRGMWPGGGKIPFGYDYDPEQGILVPNGDAETVRLMYQLYLKGWSMMRIARTVGLKYERMAEQILKRKTNLGIIVYNGVEYPGQHEPIIDVETYRAVMEQMKQRSRGSLPSTGAKHLLAGLLVCGVCGAKMRYQKWGKRGEKIYCYSQDKGKPHLSGGVPCHNPKVWASEVEETVCRDLFRFAKADDGEEGGGFEDTMEKQLQKQLETVRRKLKNLYALYAGSGDDLLRETIADLQKEQREAEEAYQSFQKDREKRQAGEKIREKVRTIEEAWEYLTEEEKRRVLEECIEKVVITGERIDVYYRPGMTEEKKEN